MAGRVDVVSLVVEVEQQTNIFFLIFILQEAQTAVNYFAKISL